MKTPKYSRTQKCSQKEQSSKFHLELILPWISDSIDYLYSFQLLNVVCVLLCLFVSLFVCLFVCSIPRSPYPYLFEVHTPGRVFMLSAPSEDEMQSWVGMLQTLKQYNRAKTLNREATLRVSVINSSTKGRVSSY